jgi:hypothetical protein
MGTQSASAKLKVIGMYAKVKMILIWSRWNLWYRTTEKRF